MKGAVLVAGGTGNVGSFVVSELLRNGATVAVPSRSQRKLAGLRDFLERQGTLTGDGRLVTVEGDLTRASEAEALLARIAEEAGPPRAALASLGTWRSAPSLLSADPDDLQTVLDGYLLAHYRIARHVIPLLQVGGGSYVFVNGPLAFDVWPGSAAAFVSIATSAQHMLFEALSQELAGSPVEVSELVSHAFIRDRETQPGSPLSGEAVGAFACHLLSGGANAHGRSIALRSHDQLQGTGYGLDAQGGAGASRRSAGPSNAP